ncbi:SGNH/GDSL hydrolase family protein [Oceanobacillus chungangensis]|uniref:Hydrolase n=1 Tax=Oceanobacillus chungangensis TaxID=1229152 RepID=A0A3D8PY06_9BACI|nr:SGNH/GDSL hydrolase family protein [Oceanobacillus chungangensis]RDW20662.1 hypothetical protein CWR45_05390 [Oceanobacillus chungangensis]
MGGNKGLMKENQLTWYSPKEYPFQINGFAWFKQENMYRRLPKQLVPGFPSRVNELANNTSGGQIRFKTNAVKLSIKAELSEPATMGHMTAVGQCGFDLYIGEPGKQQYFSSAIPPIQETSYESILWDFTGEPNQLREVTINFPLYQGVSKVLIGVDPDASIELPTPYDSKKRVLFYGTSITQGGCASRPGMSYTNILSRRFHLEHINLGFSGSGKGEKDVVLTIREIENPACFVIDYEANVTPEEYDATLVPFIQLFREYHPFVPIIVISRIYHAQNIIPKLNNDFMKRRNHSESTVEELKRNGDDRIMFVDGSTLLGERWHECTVDGSHPNDLGFMNMANGLEIPLRSSLKMAGVL